MRWMFLWDMAQCLWMIGTQNFETTDGLWASKQGFWNNENNMTRYANVKLKFNNFIIKNICLNKNFWVWGGCSSGTWHCVISAHHFEANTLLSKWWALVTLLHSAMSQNNGGFNCTAGKPKTRHLQRYRSTQKEMSHETLILSKPDNKCASHRHSCD